MKTNRTARTSVKTHEGGNAARQTAETQLLRQVASCMLFESTFYESGNVIADSIAKLCQQVSPEFIGTLANEARTRLNLRHVSLFLAVQLLKTDAAGDYKAAVIASVIQRADELAEIFAIYWRVNGKDAPVASALKRGVAAAFLKFNEYQLAKYNRPGEVKLRDALFISHAKPDTKERAKLFKKLVTNTLETPDTWEVELSKGADKKETFERLITERKLGYMALLRNLRNMHESNVEREIVITALLNGAATSRALPFRYVAAWRFAPSYTAALDAAMIKALVGYDKKLSGSTVVVIDVSGSMDGRLSLKSEISRIDAAAALAVLCREVCDDVRVFTFSDKLVEVPAHRGLGLVVAIDDSQPHGSTYLKAAVQTLNRSLKFDRMIVITDEQSHDGMAAGAENSQNYLVNVASYAPGLSTTSGWTRIDGFSERLLDFIDYSEKSRD